VAPCRWPRQVLIDAIQLDSGTFGALHFACKSHVSHQLFQTNVVLENRVIFYAKEIDRAGSVGNRIMITIIHNVSRVTSAGCSEELAESHVNRTTQLATEDSEKQSGLGGSYPSTIPATHRLSHLRHRLPLINDNIGVC
jgi:hypothetical protein